MRAIDVDPHLLEKHAKLSVRAGEEGWRHMAAEIVGEIPNLMTTLCPQGPYAYTIMPQVFPDGRVKSPIITTREEIEKAYIEVRGRSWIHASEALIEIRAPWYQFTESVSTSQVKGQDKINFNHLITLFPLGSGGGITGELVWVKVPRALMGTGPIFNGSSADELTLRRQLLALHDTYMRALADNNAAAVVATFADGAQAAIRDFVAETGTLVALEGADANAEFYIALFQKFEFLSVALLQRAVQDWYVFAELRLIVRLRATGETLVFHTAEFFIPGKDGRFIIRVGHGTDPATATAE